MVKKNAGPNFLVLGPNFVYKKIFILIGEFGHILDWARKGALICETAARWKCMVLSARTRTRTHTHTHKYTYAHAHHTRAHTLIQYTGVKHC